MGVRVLKFGGTSVETPAHILSVARRILAARELGDPIVVVVSAMGQTTDELIRLAERVSRTPPRRELDMLLTAGERISMTLLAMCLESMGCPAISFTGSQSGIMTDSLHSDARILAVRGTRIEEELARGRVVIVAGFQGVSREKEVTTLGRGGSDTTAVALAIRLGAERCEIYTDVPGVLSADPRVVAGARRIPHLGYDPMIVLSHLGGRVLFRRAVILARKYGLAVEVLSSLTSEPGTLVGGAEMSGDRHDGSQRQRRQQEQQPQEHQRRQEQQDPEQHHQRQRPQFHRQAAPGSAGSTEEEPMESGRIIAVALESPIHWVRVLCPPGNDPEELPGLPQKSSPLFLAFHRAKMPDGTWFVQFAAAPDPALDPWLESAAWGPGARLEVERHAALLSLVGEDVLSDAGILRRAEESLRGRGIPVWASQTGSLSLSLLVPESRGEAASRALHEDLVSAG